MNSGSPLLLKRQPGATEVCHSRKASNTLLHRCRRPARSGAERQNNHSCAHLGTLSPCIEYKFCFAHGSPIGDTATYSAHMGYTFFGAFTDPHPDLRRVFSRRWPDADIVDITEPFHGLAVRFSDETWETGNGTDIPDTVTKAALGISSSFPDVRIVLLHAECFGGECENWGLCLRNGRVVMNEPYVDDASGGALRRLISNFGVDIGEREIFKPLARAFPWKG